MSPRAAAGANPQSHSKSGGLPWRAPTAWLLGAFFALQAALAYAYLAWLPPAYEARGWTAGAAGSLLGALNVAQLLTAVILPALVDRSPDRRVALLGAVSLTVVGAVWLFALPGVLPWVATSVVGLGLGGRFSLTIMLIVDSAADPVASGGLAALVFLIGYSAGALTPVAIGVLHDSFGSYGLAFGVLALIALAQLATATRLGPGHLGAVEESPKPIGRRDA